MERISLILLAIGLAFVAGVAVGSPIERARTYGACLEDEVLAYSGDFPSDVEWSCVPLDDLIP